MSLALLTDRLLSEMNEYQHKVSSYTKLEIMHLEHIYLFISPVAVGNDISFIVNLPIKKVKISLLQAVEVPRVARGRGSHIT
jgi:hypothetical protein